MMAKELENKSALSLFPGLAWLLEGDNRKKTTPLPL